MESSPTYWSDLAALAWQIDLGADEAIADAPINRFELEPAKPNAAAPPPTVADVPVVAAPDVDAVQVARAAADGSTSLAALEQAQSAFDLCDLKRGARNFVFADGTPGARVMVLGEAPGREEDQAGRPFVGQAGQLLDKMFMAIGLDRSSSEASAGLYITNVLPWRPPSNRTPTPDEIAMMLPFVERHVALAAPDVLVLMGNTPCQALLGRAGITRIRGQWQEVLGRPTMPMFHPAYLLRTPAAKREAWADLLDIKAKLRTLT